MLLRPASSQCLLYPLRLSQLFFTCSNGDGSAQATWYQGIKQKLKRLIFQRKLFGPDAVARAVHESESMSMNK